jgi:hypothetical protein
MTKSEYDNNRFLSDYGVNWLFDFLNVDNLSSTYTQIVEELIEYDTSKKIIPIWNNNQPILSNFYTQSNQDTTNFRDYSLNVYSTKSCGTPTKEFTIEYGHANGYGTSIEYPTEKTETKAIYRKYGSIFGQGVLDDYTHFYALKFNKSSSQDTLYSELFEIKLTNPYTSSRYSDIINLEYFQSQSVFDFHSYDICNLVSGSLENGIYYENGSPIYFGKLYPKEAIALFDGNVLDTKLSFNTQTASYTNGKNAERFLRSISGSIYNFNNSTYKYWSYIHGVIERQVMTMPIKISFDQMNYTTNPTFYDQYGRIKTNQFINDPNTYFTTIGFYNNKYQLLAVAKLSKPLLKNFNEMYMFQVNLEIK